MEVWIGFYDFLMEGWYVWVDGLLILFFEWLFGEFDGNEVENCIV